MRHLIRSELRYPGLWSGCVGAWAPCLGPTGSALRDWSGRGNHGALTNMDAATDWVVSGGKCALDFDGNDDNVEATTPIPPAQSSVSVSFWAASLGSAVGNGTGNRLFLTWGGANQTIAIYADHTNATYNGCFTTGSGYEVVTMVTKAAASEWAHYVMTATATQIQGFVNGVSQGTAACTLDTFANGTLWLGKGQASGQYRNCQIDDVRVYNRILIDSEIQLLARRRGIAYETKRRTRGYVAAGGGNRRRRLLCRSAV